MSFLYSQPVQLPESPSNFREYTSRVYFGRQNSFYRIFYGFLRDRRVLMGNSGYLLIRVIIVGSLLATIHNLCQYCNFGFYNDFREIVKRPLFVIYGLILLSLFFLQRRLLVREFKTFTQRGIVIKAEQSRVQ